MTELEVMALFDPELILASEEATGQLDFWLRLQGWIQDRRPRMDLLTSKAFLAMMENPPNLPGLPLPEFWKIASNLAPRVVDLPIKKCTVCRTHVRQAYVPFFGRHDNIETLVNSLSRRPDTCGVALASDSRCWTDDIPNVNCLDCKNGYITVYFSPNDSLAHVWRHRFLETMPTAVTAIQNYAKDMFPRLRFSHQAWNHLETLGGSESDITSRLVKHLGVLNDKAPEIWKTYSTTVARMSALGSSGINASPENTNTSKMKTTHTFLIEGEDVVCMWHTKMQRNRDRIYFAVDGETILVGTITKHL